MQNDEYQKSALVTESIPNTQGISPINATRVTYLMVLFDQLLPGLDELKTEIFYGAPPPIVGLAMDEKQLRLFHAALGKLTEAGEFAMGVFRSITQKTPADEVNLMEEIGDGFWYDAIAADALQTNFSVIQEANIAKLKARYGNKFSQDSALKRNLDEERKVLDESWKSQCPPHIVHTSQ